MQRKYVAVAALLLFSGLLYVAGVPVRAQQPAAGNDVLPALLTEVRGLRAAMEQMASANAQAQLLVGRLQLQEGRIASMIRRLDTVRDSLATARTGYLQLAGSVRMLEHGDDSGVDAKERNGVVGGLKSQAAAAKANVDRLAAEELQLTSDIATEQARWVDINQRLDQLERTLARR